MEGDLGDDRILGNGDGDRVYEYYGNDTWIGGDGDDLLMDGDANNKLCSGPGADTIAVRYGSGTAYVDAVDGELDTVTCDAGGRTTTVDTDAADVVSADCETVNRH